MSQATDILLAPSVTRDVLTDDLFFELLDGSRPSIEKPKEAWNRGDSNLAKRLLREHMRTRRSPAWFFDGRDGETLPQTLSWPSRGNGLSAETVARGEELLRGTVQISDGIVLELGPEFNWRTRETTDLGVPGNGFRTGSFFLTLAGAFQQTEDTRFAVGFAGVVEHWLDQWPFTVDSTHTPETLVFSEDSGFKSLPTGVRLFNLLSTLFLAAPYSSAVSDDLFFKLVKEISFTAAQYLRYLDASYRPGNHHIMRCGTIPAFVALALPEFAPLEALLTPAGETVRRHAEEGILPDGGYEERSSSYSLVSIEMMMAPVRLADANGVDLVDDKTRGRIRGAVEAAAKILQPDGTMPAVGDGSFDRRKARQFFVDAAACFPDSPVSDATGCLGITNDPDDRHQELAHSTKAASGVDQTGADRDAACTAAEAQLGTVTYLPHAGYFVARTSWAPTASAVTCAIPDGSCPQTGHSHADQLTVYYVAKGIPIIGDPAATLYIPVNQPQFRGTALRGYPYSADAHNVVLPFGKSHASPESMADAWGAAVVPVSSTVEESTSEVRLVASHGADPRATVHREVAFSADGGIRVVDSVEPTSQPGSTSEATTGPHILRWHFCFGVDVVSNGNLGLRASRDGVVVHIEFAGEADTELRLYRNEQWFDSRLLPAPADSPPWVAELRFGASDSRAGIITTCGVSTSLLIG